MVLNQQLTKMLFVNLAFHTVCIHVCVYIHTEYIHLRLKYECSIKVLVAHVCFHVAHFAHLVLYI